MFLQKLRMSWRDRLRATGRGDRYSPGRGLVEHALTRVYAGDWPGRLWARVPGAAVLARIEHRLALLRPGSAPLRIGFASDLHLGPTTASSVLDAAFAHLADAALDVLLLGGDYVYLAATRARTDELRERVAALRIPTKLAVLGNHDLWTTHPDIERALEAAGARVLVNANVRLPDPFGDIAIVGLDEPWTGTPDAAAALRGTEDAALRIGLCHSPDGVHYLAGRGVALLLAGHTHGGQIALPGPRPIVLPPGPYSQRYAWGRHEIEGMTLIVSRGVGTTELPIRAWAQPDVIVVELCAGAG